MADLLRGAQGGLLYLQTPQWGMFHQCDWAEALTLCNSHVTTTAQCHKPVYINVIFLQHSLYSWSCILTFALSLLLLALPSCPSPVAFILILFPVPSLLLTGLTIVLRLVSPLCLSAPAPLRPHIPSQTSHLCSWSYQWTGSGDRWLVWIDLCQKEHSRREKVWCHTVQWEALALLAYPALQEGACRWVTLLTPWIIKQGNNKYVFFNSHSLIKSNPF